MGVDPRLVLMRARTLAGEHKLFTGALAVGAVLRLVASIGYPGALWFAGDSYVYLGAALRPQPNLSKSTGYSLFLRLLEPFHSLTLVTAVQHLMGLAVAVLIYVLLRRSNVSKTWSAIATLPVLLDGYIIENEHLIMAETVFTFLLMVATVLLLWRPGPVRWWVAVLAGLLVGYAAVVRTEGAVMLVVLPLFLLLRGWGWKTLRGWLVAIVFAVASLVPVAGYASWFHHRTGHYGMTMSTGFYLWGRVSSFADCARIKPTGDAAVVCPTTPIVDRTPPGNFVWHAPQTHQDMDYLGGPVSYKGNQVLTNFAIKAVEAQPLDYLKTVFFNTAMSFGFPRVAYPGAGTTYYYSFHLHYVTAKYNLLPPDNHSWIPGGTAYQDWLSYGHQAPGVVHKVFAIPIAVYQRVVFTYGPLLALIFLVGLGGLIGVRRRGWQLRSLRLYWAPRGTTMLPWVTAAALILTPIALADFDYRYLLPAIPFACLAAGLAFAPRRAAPAVPAAPESVESTVPDQVA
jgi:dolichyl-phosphate-mannose-protein mannosyltransferase